MRVRGGFAALENIFWWSGSAAALPDHQKERRAESHEGYAHGHLTLLLLGTPEIRHAGRVATFPTRKALALLTYLAVEGGQHSREKLTALFWPESDAERGRTVLRRTLAYLREALRAGDQPADTPHLVVERDALGFNPTDVESDH